MCANPRQILLLLSLIFTYQITTAQAIKYYSWWNPVTNEFPVIEGAAGNGRAYQPGVYLKFTTNAADIVIRYTVQRHIGAAELDLYALDRNGKWTSMPANISFGDTIVYHFSNLEKDVEYRLFLPLYQTVHWMEIGVPGGSTFTAQPLQPEKPIVLYGHLDACTALLERKLDRPIIHLDIPKNDRQKKAAIKRMSNMDAALYVLDWSIRTKAIGTLQTRHPNIPVLLIHNTGKMLKTTGIKNVYSLTDTGMAACEKMIRLILQQSIGETVTTIPVVQSRDGLYNWQKRHAEVLALNKTKAPLNVIMGNSIIHYWGGEPKGPFSRGEDSWDQWLEPLGVRNMGFGWDKIENVLWRVYHDELDGFKARHVVLMIGTNNLSGNRDEEIIEGLKLLVQAVKQRQPVAKILLSGLLPRRSMEARIERLNRSIEQLAVQTGAVFIDPGKLLLNAEGKIEEPLFGDGLHPNAAGYQKIAPALSELLRD